MLILKNMNIKEEFKKLIGFYPYPFQEKVFQAILEGKSVILRAPTGSGKSEAILAPFLYTKIIKKDSNFFNQLIYALPIRVLVENLGNRFRNYCKDRLKVAVHHGENPESELFLEDVIITTIDQTVGAYCCTPLSMSLRSGNIPAGSVSSAFLVFDEIHVYNPEFALQAILNILHHSSIFKLPFVILSATLPDSFLNFFKNSQNFNGIPIEIIDVEKEIEIESRKKRKVHILSKTEKSILEYLSNTSLPKNKKVIIVCNTINKAQQVFASLKKKYENVFLIHSQFIPADRKEKEEKVSKVFGKNSKENGILVTTQVIEVGMDISCNLMISELAQIDALIQRAGRIARWGGEGYLIISGLDKNEKNPYAPYSKEICQKTEETLKKLKKKIKLDWNLEKQLANKILNKYFKKYLESGRKYEILNILSSAAFEGDKNLIELAVRGEDLTCQLAIHRNPEKLGNKIFYLPRINVSLFKLKKFLKEISPKCKLREKVFFWEVVENNILDSKFIDEKISKFKVKPAEEIRPYKFYIISSDFISYSKENGLVFKKEKSDNFKPLVSRNIKEKQEKEISLRRELWKIHALNTLKVFRDKFLNQNKFIFKKLADAWQIPESEIVKYLELAILLHDIGKLNKEWQKKIYEIEREKWDKSKKPLSHSSKKEFIYSSLFHE